MSLLFLLLICSNEMKTRMVETMRPALDIFVLERIVVKLNFDVGAAVTGTEGDWRNAVVPASTLGLVQ